MATDLTDTIGELAQAPIKIEGDGGSVQERPISEVIAADRYVKGQSALRKTLGGVRLTKVIPSGSV